MFVLAFPKFVIMLALVVFLFYAFGPWGLAVAVALLVLLPSH